MLNIVSVRNTVLSGIIIFTGLASALAFPALANWQGFAAQNEAASPGYNHIQHSRRKAANYTTAGSSDLIHDIENSPAAFTDTYRVSKLGNGSNPTAGWVGAFNNLQDALGAASAGDEIWVAAGVYKPGDTVSDSFKLVPGVAVYGGFTGTETARSERDWHANTAVLSGDIDGNDKTDTRGIVASSNDIKGDNSYHVVYAEMVSGTAVLDGFTITGGSAILKQGNNDNGGGFLCYGHNTAQFIEGICSPQLFHITFAGNRAMYGGGMSNDGLEGVSDPVLRDVIFTGNSAASYGGAMVNYAQDGKSRPVLTNVLFSGNSAGEWGGAIANFGHLDGDNHPILTNVTLSGNQATDKGGGIFNYGTKGTCLPSIRNSIIWNNRDSSGTGTLTANIYNQDARTTLYHSLVQGSGGTGNFTTTFSYGNGGGNIDEDPKFLMPINPITTTSSGNLHLQIDSPAIDAGDIAYVIDVPADLDGHPRLKDGNGDGEAIVDMGAYEIQMAYTNKQFLSVVFR